MRRFQRKQRRYKHSLHSIADTENLAKTITLQMVVSGKPPAKTELQNTEHAIISISHIRLNLQTWCYSAISNNAIFHRLCITQDQQNVYKANPLPEFLRLLCLWFNQREFSLYVSSILFSDDCIFSLIFFQWATEGKNISFAVLF